MVEPSAVNRVVVGSNPTGGAREPPPFYGGFVIPSKKFKRKALIFYQKLICKHKTCKPEKYMEFSSAKRQQQDYIKKTSKWY